ncbi:MAG: putative nonstructural protein [Corparats virus 2]|nr:MAG: putative nonstructural protein [Corparats virus 2]
MPYVRDLEDYEFWEVEPEPISFEVEVVHNTMPYFKHLQHTVKEWKGWTREEASFFISEWIDHPSPFNPKNYADFVEKSWMAQFDDFFAFVSNLGFQNLKPIHFKKEKPQPYSIAIPVHENRFSILPESSGGDVNNGWKASLSKPKVVYKKKTKKLNPRKVNYRLKSHKIKNIQLVHQGLLSWSSEVSERSRLFENIIKDNKLKLEEQSLPPHDKPCSSKDTYYNPEQFILEDTKSQFHEDDSINIGKLVIDQNELFENHMEIREESPYEDPSIINNFKSIIMEFVSKFNFDAFSVTAIVSQLLVVFGLIWSLRRSRLNKQLKVIIISSFVGLCSTILYASKLSFPKKTIKDMENIVRSVLLSKKEEDVVMNDISSHKRIISQFRSRLAVRKYIFDNKLENSIKLPSCTFMELEDKFDDNYYWIFKNFDDEFLAMWFGVALWKLESIRSKIPVELEKQSFIQDYYVFLKQLALRLFGITTSWILTKIHGENFTKRDIMDGIQLAKDFNTFSGDIIDTITGISVNKRSFYRIQSEEYVKHFNSFLEIPTYDFVRNQRKIHDINSMLEDCNKFIREAPKEYKDLLYPLQGLSTAVYKRKNELLTSSIPNFKRQEPFVVLFQGQGGIGKTSFIQQLAGKCTTKLINDGSMDKDYIEIRHDDKYWPPLAGQRVAFFDEAGTVADIKDDLLFSNIKGICSPAYFNMPAADIEHKVIPCPFHLIFASTNRKLFDLQAKLSLAFSSDSVYPIWRRCIVITTEWNEQRFGKFNFVNPQGYQSDFSHLKFKINQWNQQTQRLEEASDISVEDIYELIRNRYRKMESDHSRVIDNMNMLKQSNLHKSHYCVHLHGSPGQGKTPSILEYAKSLKRIYSMPVKIFTSWDEVKNHHSNTRSIYILDDMFINQLSSENQQIYLDWYNNRIIDSSIILICSNLKIKYSLPIIRGTNLIIPRKHPFELNSLTRRIGLTGRFANELVPNYNVEFIFKNDQAYIRDEISFPWWKILLFMLSLMSGLINPIFIVSLPVLVFFLNSCKNSQISDPEQYIFDRYSDFIKMKQQCTISEGSRDTIGEYDYILQSESLEKLNFSTDKISNIRHLHSKLHEFDKDENSWKMYVTQNLIETFKNNYELFLIDCSQFSHDHILKELQRIARIFIQYGISPKIKIIVKNLGEYYLKEDSIVYHTYESISRVDTASDLYLATNHNGLIFIDNNCRVDISFEDVYLCSNIPLKYKLDIRQSKLIYAYIDSNQFQNSVDYKNFLNNRYQQISFLTFQNIREKTKRLLIKFFGTPEGRLGEFIVGMIFFLFSMYRVFNGISSLFKSKKVQDDPELEAQIFAKVKTWNKEKRDQFWSIWANREDDYLDDERSLDKEQFALRKMHYVPSHYTDVRRRVLVGPKDSRPPLNDKVNPSEYSDTDISDNEENIIHGRQLDQNEINYILGYKHDLKKGKKRPVLKDGNDTEPERRSHKKGKKRPILKNGNDTDIEKEKHISGPLSLTQRYQLKLQSSKRKQYIKDLENMNNYDSYMPYCENAHNKVTKNLVQVYINDAKEDIINYEPKDGLANYAVFIKKNLLVTVGHLVDQMKLYIGCRLYVGCDQFKGKFYKARLLRNYKLRDLSVWEVERCPFDFPDISNLFFSRDEIRDGYMINSVICRYGPNKKEIWLLGMEEFVKPFMPLTEGGIEQAGIMDFGIFGTPLTTYGDCGLPHLSIDKCHQNKIIGIHCMGSTEAHPSIGVSSLIWKEDIVEWMGDISKPLNKQGSLQEPCDFCQVDLPVIKRAKVSKSQDKNNKHEVLFGDVHDSSPATFYREIKQFLDVNKTFTGTVLKNTGNKLGGSVEHSHTQFIFNEFENLKISNGWKTATASEIGFNKLHVSPKETVSYVVKDCQIESIYSTFNVVPHVKDFRIRINIYITESLKRRATIGLYILHNSKLPQTELDLTKQGMIPLGLTDDQETYACDDIKTITGIYQKRYQRGEFPDIPYDKMEDNSNVQIVGIAHRNMSPLPDGKFYPTPFSLRLEDETSPHKYPARFDGENAPESEKQKMDCDLFGRPDALITQARRWAHRIVAPNPYLRSFAKSEYRSNILAHYSNMSLLTDHQVLHGYQSTHSLGRGLDGLTLDSACGWTLKQLYTVNKKSDLISVDMKGNYAWEDNEAAQYLKYMYYQAKELAKDGKRYWSVFNELLKAEKLKKEKMWIPRSFIVEDFLGILMQRYILGEFCARAKLNDPNVGIGINPYTQFDKHANYLMKHPNMFTGDYKNFDRTIPLCAFDDIRDLLMEANPHMANEIQVCIDCISRNFQIAANTLSYVVGGMPSGCLLTAPLNSKLNDYMIFTAYISLCWKHGRDEIANYVQYERLVHRRFYGDDVQLSCSNDVAEFFNLVSLSDELKIQFGMEMTASSKEGEKKFFETYDEASWISRFIRKADKFPFYFGALKKITIHTQFHYLTSLSPQHMGDIYTTIQEEAALWDQEFFNKIQRCIHVAVSYNKDILNHFSFKSRLDIQEQFYRSALTGLLIRNTKDIPTDIPTGKSMHNWTDLVENDPEYSADQSISEHQIVPQLELKTQDKNLYDKILRFNNRKFRKQGRRYSELNSLLTRLPDFVAFSAEAFASLNLSERNLNNLKSLSSTMQINELFQNGLISKPCSEYTSIQEKWICTITSVRQSDNNSIKGIGKGVTKAQAREEAAERFLEEYVQIKLQKQSYRTLFPRLGLKLESNISAGVEHATPGAPMISADPSIAPDTGIATNTMTVSPARVINPLAQALDNPAGTGAAFDKKDAIYGIYTRWTEKQGTINGSLNQGAEVFRLSLNPQTLPQRIREYIAFHQSLIPQIDVQILIGGAAGSIGWLKLGWVPDDSKTYTLDDLQLVAAEELNLNNTLTMQCILNDNRKNGMYRYVDNDPEPWPALILMIDHPALNVQRNDDVNYPVFVNVRLGPQCCLMQPYNMITTELSSGTIIDLNRYLKLNSFDLLIGTSSICDNVVQPHSFPDCGFLTGDFKPKFSKENWCGTFQQAGTVIYTTLSQSAFQTQVDSGIIIKDFDYASVSSITIPGGIVFGYGNIPEAYTGMSTRVSDALQFNSTKYTIPKYTFRTSSGLEYACSQIEMFESGCIMYFLLDNVVVYNISYSNNNTQFTLTSKGDRNSFGQTINVAFLQNYMDPGKLPISMIDLSTPIGFQPLTCWEYRSSSQIFSITSSVLTFSRRYYIAVARDDTRISFDNAEQADRLYVWSFIQTGNTAPATALPNQIKVCSLIRPGTTTTQVTDNGFYPMIVPGLEVVYTQLDQIMDNLGANLLQFSVLVQGQVIARLAYTQGAFLGRTSSIRLIRTALTKDIRLTEIARLDNINVLPLLPTQGFSSWNSSSSQSFRSKVVDFLFQKQSGAFMAVGALGGLFNGLANTMQFQEYNEWKDAYQKRHLDTLKQLEGIRGENQLNLSKQNFDQKMQLLGFSNVSSQQGHNQGTQTGRNPNDPLPDLPYQSNLYNYPYYGANNSTYKLPFTDSSSSSSQSSIGTRYMTNSNYSSIYNGQNSSTRDSIISGNSRNSSTRNSFLDIPSVSNQISTQTNQPSITTENIAVGTQDLPPKTRSIEDKMADAKGISNQFSNAIAAHPQGHGAVMAELKSKQMHGSLNQEQSSDLPPMLNSS